MFVVWGTKRTVKRVGFAADFCGICHDLRCARIDRIGAADHVYGLSAGQGQLVGHLATCLECGSAHPTDPSLFRELLPRPTDDATELVRETFPQFEEAFAARLHVESLLRRNQAIPPEARHELLREPFLQLDPEVEAVYAGSSRIDGPGLISLLAMVVLPIVAGFTTSAIVGDEPPDANTPAVAAGLGFAVAFLAFLGCLVTSPRRWVARKVLPRLARGLAPLRPSIEELEEVHRQLRSMGLRIAKKIRPARIEMALAEHGDGATERTWYDFSKAPRPTVTS